MPLFHDPRDRARYMEAEKIAVDLATALMIGEPAKDEEAEQHGTSDRECSDNSQSGQI